MAPAASPGPALRQRVARDHRPQDERRRPAGRDRALRGSRRLRPDDRRARSRRGPRRGSAPPSAGWPMPSSVSTGRARSSSATRFSRSSAGRVPTTTIRSVPRWPPRDPGGAARAGRRRRAAGGPDRPRHGRGRGRRRAGRHRRPRGHRRGDHDRRPDPVARPARRDPARRGDGPRRPRPAGRRGPRLGRPARPVHRWSTSTRWRPVDVGLADGHRRVAVARASRRPDARIGALAEGRSSGRAEPGIGTTVLVIGDAGMGKSRLLAELEPDARRLGYRWTWTENVSYGRGEPYRFARVFAQAVADEHGIDSGAFARRLLFSPDVDEATRRRLGGAIAAIARDANFSGWEAESGDMPVDPTERRDALLEVARSLHRPAAQRPTARASSSSTMSTGSIRRVPGWSSSSSRTAAVRPLVSSPRCGPVSRPPGPACPHVERIGLDGLAPPETARLATIVARAAAGRDGRSADPRSDRGQPALHRRDGPGLDRGRHAHPGRWPHGARRDRSRVCRSPCARSSAPASTVSTSRRARPRRRLRRRHRISSTALVRDLLGRPVPDGTLGALSMPRWSSPAEEPITGGSATRSSAMPPTPGCSRRGADGSTPASPTRSKRVRTRVSPCGSPCIALRPVTRREPSRCCSKRPSRPVGRGCGRGCVVLADGR